MQKLRRKLSLTQHETTMNNFEKTINQFPIYPCVVCERLMYSKTVKKCDKKYFHGPFPTWFLTPVLTAISDDSVICITCLNHLKAKSVPPQSFPNNLQVDKYDALSHLTNFESRLLAKRKTFYEIGSIA